MNIPDDKKIILFDGVCNLCNSAVQFVIKRDKKDVFRFAPLQSATARDFIEQRGMDAKGIDSIILIVPNVAYHLKSSVALHIAYELGAGWKMLKIVEWVLPARLRDVLYDVVAKNRYRWFGKKQYCMIPTVELQAKFLEVTSGKKEG